MSAEQTSSKLTAPSDADTALDFLLSPSEGEGDFLYTARVLSSTADLAEVSYFDSGQRKTLLVPLSEVTRGQSFSQGEEFVGLLSHGAGFETFTMNSAKVIERLFAGVSPELRDGRVKIVKSVREPGVRSKVAVASTVPGLDPVSALVGRAHNRIDYVRGCLSSERVDVVAWHPDLSVFIANALQPASINHVRVAEDEATALVYAPEHQMAAAVGLGGLNARLASELVGARIRVTAKPVPSSAAPLELDPGLEEGGDRPGE